ncbi:leucine-rich repeat receptor protein kinase MSL1-like [Oryza brachyantha]|uniref:leucine-rich repeat receptor protein kinase MSL1-like n=1 Tax=Oryza brachyantha TaxID=4533 RepID=UPI001ADBD568|nr:leucine-rich repeat receptor protein kinase MSL1-like [Oryza brachyantha]
MVLDNNLFSGQLSPAIAHLQQLTVLSMSMNSFSGGLPPELGSLQSLEHLYLHTNEFSGSIPASFGNLSRLLYLDVRNNNLTGSILPGIRALINLVKLDLSSNSLTGPIPKELYQLKNLQSLILSDNELTGSISEEIGNLKQLEVLNLLKCKLSGTIPLSIGNLENLKELYISFNNFIGELPASVGELHSLTQLMTKSAGLTGSIPKELELADLAAIILFDVEGNKLSGHIPDWIQNWSNVSSMSLAQNMFYGPLPHMPLHLVSLSAESNQLSGSIPAKICQGTSLQVLRLNDNNLTGSIGETFKGCKNLTELSLLGNHLQGEIPEYLALLPLVSLDLSHNNFTGMIPDKLCESSTMLDISLSDNQLTGMIPDSIGKLLSLRLLSIDRNYLQGPLPRSIGALRNLTALSLSGNMLSGDIPLELFNCRNLVMLDLSSNNLTGHIPKAISHLTKLNTLVLSQNRLSGAIPSELCVAFSRELTGHIPRGINNCSILVELHLQGNMLSGTIPVELGELRNITTINLSSNALVGPVLPWTAPFASLQGLFMSGNRLNGSIPAGIGSILPQITMLDLSGNALTGNLPLDLLCKKSLNHLDVSHNNITGQIPFSCHDGKESPIPLVFLNASSNCLSGSLDESISNFTKLTYLDLHNNSLTGRLPSALAGISSLYYLDFSSNDFSGDIPCGICNMFGLSFANFSGNRNDDFRLADCDAEGGVCAANRKHEPLSINLATFEHAPMRVAVDEIMRATRDFNGLHVVGDGGFGTVYRAELPGGRRVAVKRLHGGRRFQGGEREFRAEMETIGKVKHPNLVSLLGYCASGDERFLVYEYMEHGSLEGRLRGSAADALGWPERLRICGGAARGLAFLHHGFVPHVIHRDVKSSNILLGEGLEPRVSDFGLARIISACETHVSTDLAGTLGYIPPEYALSMRCTARGDVYSFGVVMLELLTGRPPTSPSSEEPGGDGSLVGWVRWMAARGRDGEVFDRCLPVSGAQREQMARVLDVARDCTADEPWRRPTMADVARRVEAIQAMECGPLVVAVSVGPAPCEL